MFFDRNPTPSDRYAVAAKAILESTDVDTDLVKHCFWELKAQHDACATRIARWLIFGSFAIVIFELLNRKLINSASLSFVQVTHLAFGLYVLPPFVSLAFLNMFSLYSEGVVYDHMAAALARKAFPAFSESGIVDLFLSRSGMFGA